MKTKFRAVVVLEGEFTKEKSGPEVIQAIQEDLVMYFPEKRHADLGKNDVHVDGVERVTIYRGGEE